MQFRFALPIAFVIVTIFGVYITQHESFVPQSKFVSRRSVPDVENDMLPLPMDFLPFDPPLKWSSGGGAGAGQGTIDEMCKKVADNTTYEQINKISSLGYNYTCDLVEYGSLCRCKADPCSGGADDTTEEQFQALAAKGGNFTCSIEDGACRCKEYSEGEQKSIDSMSNKMGSKIEIISPADSILEFFRPNQQNLKNNVKFANKFEDLDAEQDMISGNEYAKEHV